jgi:hypothetical protein
MAAPTDKKRPSLIARSGRRAADPQSGEAEALRQKQENVNEYKNTYPGGENTEPFSEMRRTMFGGARPTSGANAAAPAPQKPQRGSMNPDDYERESKGMTIPQAKVDRNDRGSYGSQGEEQRVDRTFEIGIPKIGAPQVDMKESLLGRIPVFDDGGVPPAPNTDDLQLRRPDPNVVKSLDPSGKESTLHKIEDRVRGMGNIPDPSGMPGQEAHPQQVAVQGLDRNYMSGLGQIPLYDDGGTIPPEHDDVGPVKNDPYDGHHSLAVLEENERVLTPEQNAAYEQSGFPKMIPIDDTVYAEPGVRRLNQPNPPVSVSDSDMPRMRSLSGGNISNPTGDLVGDISNPPQTEATVQGMRTASVHPELEPLFANIDNQKVDAAKRGVAGLTDLGTSLLHERELDRHNDRINTAQSSAVPQTSSYVPESNMASAASATPLPSERDKFEAERAAAKQQAAAGPIVSPQNATRALQEEMARAEKAKDLNAYNAAKAALDAQQQTSGASPMLPAIVPNADLDKKLADLDAKKSTMEPKAYRKAEHGILHEAYVQGLAKQQDIKDRAAARGDQAAYQDADSRIKELHRMNPWGTAANHDNLLGKIGHDAFKALRIAGDIGQVALATEFPAAAEFLPIYAPDRHERFQERAANLAHTEAEIGLENAQAQAAGIKGPSTQVYEWAMHSNQGKPQINPITQQPYTPAEALQMSLGQGKTPEETYVADLITRINPKTGKNYTREEATDEMWRAKAGAKPLNPKEQAVQDYMVRFHLDPNDPKARDEAREAIERRDVSVKSLAALPAQQQMAVLRQRLGIEAAYLTQNHADALSRGKSGDDLRFQEAKRYEGRLASIGNAQAVLDAGGKGEQLSAAITPVILTLNSSKEQGVNRVNQVELAKFTPQNGSFYRWATSHADQFFAGQIPDEYRKEAGNMLTRMKAQEDVEHNNINKAIVDTIDNGAITPVVNEKGVPTKTVPSKPTSSAPTQTQTGGKGKVNTDLLKKITGR